MILLVALSCFKARNIGGRANGWVFFFCDQKKIPPPCAPAELEEENLGHSIQKIFSKFGHSSEFRVFSLENIENLVLNLCTGSVYLKSSFRYGPSFFISNRSSS